MSGTVDEYEQDCLRETVLVYLWLCKIKHLQDRAKNAATAKSALHLFLEGIHQMLQMNSSMNILEVRREPKMIWTEHGFKQIEQNMNSHGENIDVSESRSSEMITTSTPKHLKADASRISAESSVNTNINKAIISPPYTISIPPNRNLGFRIKNMGKGCVVSSVVHRRLMGVVQVGDKIMSINGWSCSAASAETVRIKLDVSLRPVQIIFQPTLNSGIKQDIVDSKDYRGIPKGKSEDTNA